MAAILDSWVKVPEIPNTENPLFQYWKLPFPYTLYRIKNLLNTEFSINTENFHPTVLAIFFLFTSHPDASYQVSSQLAF